MRFGDITCDVTVRGAEYPPCEEWKALAIARQNRYLPFEPAFGDWCRSRGKDACQW